MTITSSKTIKAWARAVTVFALGLPGSMLCPAHAWFCTSDALRLEIPLTPRELTGTLRETFSLAGVLLEATHYTLYGLRDQGD